MKKFLKLLSVLSLLLVMITGCSSTNVETLDKDGWYYSKEDVSLYIYTYGDLPDNYITKNEAYDLGWNSKEGNLWDVAEGMCIGGDRFGNYEGILPKESGRQYY